MTIPNDNSLTFVNASIPLNNALSFSNASGFVQTGWNYWANDYYPQVIKESYPVYFQERAKDSGKQAFEIIKSLQDKKLMTLKTVGDFIEAMDTLIKIL